MVSTGWAWSFGRYSERYAAEEKEAVTRRAGVHGHRCIPPWEWRASSVPNRGNRGLSYRPINRPELKLQLIGPWQGSGP
jgi:hypothetical protein